MTSSFSLLTYNLKTLDTSNLTVETMMERAKWEIIHMPEKPPVSPTNQPTG